MRKNILRKKKITMRVEKSCWHTGEPQNHIHLGLTLRAEGDEQGAIDSFRAASEIDSGCLDDFVGTNILASREFYDKGLVDQAAWYARHAIEMDEQSEQGHMTLGIALWEGVLHDEAIESYRFVIGNNPNHGDAHNELGIVYLEKGFTDRAIESFRRQIRVSPNHQHAHGNLGFALRDVGLYEEAIQSYEVYLEIRPRSPNAHTGLAWVLYYQGFYDAALESLGVAIDLDPDWCNSLRDRAEFLSHVPDAGLQDFSRAVRLAEKAVELHVDYPVHNTNHPLALDLRALGQAYYRADRFEECVDALTRTIGLSAGGADASDCFFLATAHKKLGDPREASKWFDAGVEWMEGNQMSVPVKTFFSRWRDEAQTVLGE